MTAYSPVSVFMPVSFCFFCSSSETWQSDASYFVFIAVQDCIWIVGGCFSFCVKNASSIDGVRCGEFVTHCCDCDGCVDSIILSICRLGKLLLFYVQMSFFF